jgi:hypothetical protein
MATRARIEERRRILSGADWAVAQVSGVDNGRRDFVDGPVRRPISPPVVSSDDTPRMPPVPESGDFQSRTRRTLGPGMARRGSGPSSRLVRPPPEYRPDSLHRRVERSLPPRNAIGGRAVRRSSTERSHSSRSSPAARVASSERATSIRSPPLPSLTPNFSPAHRYGLDDPWTRETDPTIFGEAPAYVSTLSS